MKAGTRIGSYDVVSPLGAGGMGEVWRAHDTRIDRDVAIKLLPEDLASDPERLARFELEAKAAGALNHPNVLTVFELGTHEGHPYLVTELLEGTTLRERLGDTRRGSSSGGPLPARKALDYGAQMASGLAAAHEKGIVHRDLKPENVFVTTDGRVKILDFGLAKLTSPAADGAGQTALPTAAQPTSPGTVLGTVGYMAPEQVRGGDVDARADIFACGAVLYEMLSGRRAFDGESSADTMSAILKEDPPEAGADQSRIPVAADRIVRRCLEKEPTQRFQSARDLAFALEAVGGSSSSDRVEAIERDGRTRPLLPLTLAAVAVLVAAAAGFWAGGARQGRRSGEEIELTPLTFRSLLVFQAAFAPDGRTVVFSAAERGTVPSLYTVTADYPEPRPMGLPGTHFLAMSSKGEMAVLTEPRYIGHRLFEGTLARVQLGSTAPRPVLERVRQADWSPDGDELAVIRDVEGVDQLEFPVGRVLHRSEGYLSDLRVSPSGDRVAFFEHPVRYDDRGSLVVVDLSGRATTLADYFALQGLAWARDGESVLYSAGTATSGSRYGLYSTDLAGRSRLLRRETEALVIHDISATEKWLVSTNLSRHEVWGRTVGMDVEENLSWLSYSLLPTISTDGRMVLFTEQSSYAGLQYAACLRPEPGAPVVRLGEGVALGLSPDGRYALALIPGPPQSLVAHPVGPEKEWRLDRGNIERYNEAAQWFPDGRSVLVCGSKRDEAERCFVQPFEGGAPRALTPEGTDKGLVSPDGQEVSVRDSAGQALVVPVEGGDPRVVPGIGPADVIIQWASDGGGLLTFTSGVLPVIVERVDIQTGTRRPIRTIDPLNKNKCVGVANVSLAADGQHYVYDCWSVRSRLFTVEGLR